MYYFAMWAFVQECIELDEIVDKLLKLKLIEIIFKINSNYF